MWVRALLLLLLVSVTAPAQQTSGPAGGGEDTGYVSVDRTHATWPAPESLVNDLGSKDEGVRLRALKLIGFPSNLILKDIWSQTSPSTIVGHVVVTPDRVALNYAALGDGATRHAILSVEAEYATIVAAVAEPTDHGWERIATSSCWCKYDLEGDALSQSVQLRRAPEPEPQTPEHYELVLRASGGGTGIYTQNETHFRVYQGELRMVMNFVSRRRGCSPTGPAPHWCEVEKRWFYTTGFGNVLGGVLVTSRGRFDSDRNPMAGWSVRELEDRFLDAPTCTTYQWNRQSFQYEPISVLDACKPRAQ